MVLSLWERIRIGESLARKVSTIRLLTIGYLWIYLQMVIGIHSLVSGVLPSIPDFTLVGTSLAELGHTLGLGIPLICA